MILTLTANPSLDRSLELSGPLVPGAVHRITHEHTQVGGKGINVARAVHAADVATCALVPSAPTDPFAVLLEQTGLPHCTVPIAGAVRTNLTLASVGATTKLNEQGPQLSGAESAQLEQLVHDQAARVPGTSVLLSGSLAPGLDEELYVRLTGQLQQLGVWVGVDTSGAPLARLAAALPRVAPDFLKPNAHELGEILGISGDRLEADAGRGDLSTVQDAAQRLHWLGVAEILVTLGQAGALLLTRDGCWFQPSPETVVHSTVGAGDAATAGYLIARALGDPPAARLARAVAYGTAAVALPGTAVPEPEQIRVDAGAVLRL